MFVSYAANFYRKEREGERDGNEIYCGLIGCFAIGRKEKFQQIENNLNNFQFTPSSIVRQRDEMKPLS